MKMGKERFLMFLTNISHKSKDLADNTYIVTMDSSIYMSNI